MKRVESLQPYPEQAHQPTAPAAAEAPRLMQNEPSNPTQKIPLSAQAALKEAHDRYLDLYDFAPIAYLTLDGDASISEINITGACLLLDGERANILGRPFKNFVVPADRDRLGRMIAEVKQLGDRSTCSLDLQRGDGSTFPAQLDCVCALDRHGRHAIRIAVTDQTERRQRELEIESLAFYDPLTGLPNRRLLLDRLQHATSTSSRGRRQGAVLFLDLDNFKTLNDTQGHHAGDLVLQQAAERLTTCVRESDTVARLGGDEFVVMLENLSGDPQEAASQVRAVGQKILAAFDGSYPPADHAYRGNVSIGATLFSHDRQSVEDLLKAADLALYRAKAAGGGTLRFFEPEMQAAVLARAQLETDLRRGLDEQQFLLYYQPQVDPQGSITGVEALLRWNHPTRGILAPPNFLAVAQKRGLIMNIGQWVLETACGQLAAWSGHPVAGHWTLSVNLSSQELRHPDLLARIMSTLDRTGANPRQLTLEIPESRIPGDMADTATKMKALRAHRLRFALDDFGTGYSSLAYVRTLPIDELKIDRSFVRRILTRHKDAAIATTILTLGEKLGLRVTAKGVETDPQRAFLAEHGCKAFQGYLFGKPGPISALDLHL